MEPPSQAVTIVEVAPRDGLQNEPALLATSDKIELICRLDAAGVRRMEVASFVNATRVPRMADAEAVVAGLPQAPGRQRIGLVLNHRGLERAIAAAVDAVVFVVVASDTFCRRNQGVGTADAIAAWGEIAGAARGAGLGTQLIIGAAFGCPFEGEVPVSRLADVVAASVALAMPDELALADTIGVASPADVKARFTAIATPGLALRAHFHNTRNTGLANAVAALECGVTQLDASLGGIGGCPFAPAATGNIPTEDLVYMLQRMGIATGLDLDRLIDASEWLGERLGRPLPAMLGRAGMFPAREKAA